MTAQINDQKTYQASQMAHHMRRLSEATAAAYHILNVDTSSLPFLSSTSSNASSSSSSKSKGENSPSSNYSDRSENPLRTPSSSTFSAGLPYNATASVMSNSYNQTYPVATADRHAPNPLHANPLLYDSAPSKTDLFTCNSAILPTAAAYHDPSFFMPAFGMCQPSQGRTTVQLPQQTFAGMDSAPAAASFYTAASTSSSSPARNLHGLSAPFSSYSFDPSYPSRAYQMHAPEVDFRSYSINPQALSLDIFQAPSEPQPPPTSATVFDEVCPAGLLQYITDSYADYISLCPFHLLQNGHLLLTFPHPIRPVLPLYPLTHESQSLNDHPSAVTLIATPATIVHCATQSVQPRKVGNASRVGLSMRTWSGKA